MRNFIQFFINKPIWGNTFIALVILFGIFSIVTMKKSFFPELDPNTITVSVFYPGASPKEMEEGVTIKIEQAVKGMDAIEEVNSNSQENFSNVTIKAYQDANMDELQAEVENAINSINSFPQGAERPIITKVKSGGMGSIVAFVGISSKTKQSNSIELTDLATKVEQDLLNSKEITQITKNGFPTKEISINVRENDLLKYAISMQEIAAAISSKNLDITAGIIRGGNQEMNIRSNSKSIYPEEIEKIPLRLDGSGSAIVIGDVADVVLGYSESSQESKFNGNPAVSFQIEKTPTQDISKITEAIYAYKKKFDEENPNYEFNIFYEFNSMLNGRIDLLTSNGLTGLILVLLFLGLFLNVKLSAWVAFGIPFSFLGMFILGTVYGMTINMISLFGMILVVGILVDDGIVIAENIYSHFERGKSARQAAIDGTMEVLPSVFSSVLTTIVAFSVLFFVEGLEMMREMAFVAIACLSFSLFEAFIMLPAHLAHKNMLKENRDFKFSMRQGLLIVGISFVLIYFGAYLITHSQITFGALLLPFSIIILGVSIFLAGFSKSPMELKVRGFADQIIKKFRDNGYRQALILSIGDKRKWYRFSFFVPMIFTISAFVMLVKGIISATFFPNIPPDFFTIEAAYMPGDSKAQTDRFIAKATQIMLEENDRIQRENKDTLMSYYTSTAGFSQSIGQAGNHAGTVSVFVNSEKSKTPVDTFINRVLMRIKNTPEGKLAQELYVGGFNRFGKEIEFGLTSTNEKSILLAKDMVRKEMANIPGVMNIKDNMPPGKNEIDITLKPHAEMFGVSKGEVLNQIRQGFFGQEAQRVIIGTDEVKIWVRYPLQDRNSYHALENMKIKNALGAQIPLKEIASFKMGRAPEALKRRNGQRIIKIDAESEDPDQVGVINQKVFNEVLPKLETIFPEVSTIKLGQFERSQKTGNSMQYVTLVCLILMFILITLHFNSLSQAFLIMLVIPAGLGGAILGHGLVGIPVSILSAFGMIALIGVLVNDAIVFLDRYNDLILEGYSVKEAVLEAATSRFRPILLTSLTTVAGLLPMIYEKSMQAQFLIPMATSIAFGVLFGTIFILFFYPAAILFWNGRARIGKWMWHGRKFNELEVEPALKHKIETEHE